MNDRLILTLVLVAVLAGAIGYFVSVGLAAWFLLIVFLTWLVLTLRGARS